MEKDIDRLMAERYTGNFLDSADMSGDPVELTVKDVVAPGKATTADGRPVKDAVLQFEEISRGLICNKTNIRIMKTLYGRHAKDWVGKKVTIGVRYLAESFGEKNAPCLRIIPPKGTPLSQAIRKWMGTERPIGGDA